MMEVYRAFALYFFSFHSVLSLEKKFLPLEFLPLLCLAKSSVKSLVMIEADFCNMHSEKRSSAGGHAQAAVTRLLFS